MVALKVFVFAAAAWLVSSEAQDASAELVGLALPEVDFFVKAAEGPLKDFGDQAKMLKKQVLQSEQEKKEALAKMRKSFEQNLTAQTKASDRIIDESTKLKASMAKEQQTIVKLRQESKLLQKSNDIMRTALGNLRPKMRLASAFLRDSIKATDDSNTTLLEVLKPTTPAPTLEHFLETMDQGHKVMSLLEFDVQHAGKGVTLRSHNKASTKPTPEELVRTLSERMTDLAAAGDQGENQLMARFLVDYELGEKQQAKLLARRQALQEELAQKQALHVQLVEVKKHLLEIKSQLRERIRGVQLFADRGSEDAARTLGRAATVMKPPEH